MYTNITLKVRDLVQDNLSQCEPYIEEFRNSKVFTMPDNNIDSTTIVIYKTGSLVDSANYSYSSSTNKITFIDGYSLSAGDILEFLYSAYKKYSDSEVDSYIRSSLIHISTQGYKTFKDRSGVLFPTPDEAEENLIALIAKILMIKHIRSYRTSEVTINFTDNDSAETKIQKVISQFNSPKGVFSFMDLYSWNTYYDEETE